MPECVLTLKETEKNIKPLCLGDLSPRTTVMQTLNNISDHSLTAYIHELTHPHGNPMS